MLKIKKINRWLFNTILEDNKTKSGDAESIAASTIHTASNTPSARAVATSLVTPVQPMPPPMKIQSPITLKQLAFVFQVEVEASSELFNIIENS
jgi:hypothetical protein